MTTRARRATAGSPSPRSCSGSQGSWGCSPASQRSRARPSTSNGARFVFSDLKTWGWIVTIAAAITLCASFAIVAGAQWARWFGIVIASLQAIAQLAFIQAYPFWSLCVFTLDLLVIYALAVYGGSRKTA